MNNFVMLVDKTQWNALLWFSKSAINISDGLIKHFPMFSIKVSVIKSYTVLNSTGLNMRKQILYFD